MTIVSIHQPQYLPWIPYFQKIASSDYFVFLDNVQFQRRGVQNRNEIKGPNGSITLTVPVSSARDDLISTVKIADNKWRKKHVRSIEQCYARAKYFGYFESHVKSIIMKDYDLLADLNKAMVQMFVEFLGIKTKLVCASSLGVSGSKEDLIIDICNKLEGTEYLSGSGARVYQSEHNFSRHGIELTYHESTVKEYEQCFNKVGFTPGLSALDAILNMGTDASQLL